MINPYQIAQSYILWLSERTITGKTLEEVCKAIDLPPSNIPGGYWCVNRAGNPVYVGQQLICSDASIKIAGRAMCENPAVPACPNGSWVLDVEKNTCSRPDFSCTINTDLVSEKKLLAAIAYGESSTQDNYEEMAGIAYAIIRRRDAAHESSVNKLVKKFPNFSYVIADGNERYRKLMCSEDTEFFEEAFMAADNAISHGIDYANGGCFWDGYDLKTGGKYAYRYVKGFRYSNPSHNIFLILEPDHNPQKGQYGYYDNMYISTAAHGKTIFWRVDEQYLTAKGAMQCR